MELTQLSAWACPTVTPSRINTSHSRKSNNNMWLLRFVGVLWKFMFSINQRNPHLARFGLFPVALFVMDYRRYLTWCGGMLYKPVGFGTGCENSGRSNSAALLCSESAFVIKPCSHLWFFIFMLQLKLKIMVCRIKSLLGISWSREKKFWFCVVVGIFLSFFCASRAWRVSMGGCMSRR